MKKRKIDQKTIKLFKKTNDLILDSIIKFYIYNPVLVVFMSITLFLYFITCYLFDLSYFSAHFIWIFPFLLFIVIFITALIQTFTGFIDVAEYYKKQYEYTETSKK